MPPIPASVSPTVAAAWCDSPEDPLLRLCRASSTFRFEDRDPPFDPLAFNAWVAAGHPANARDDQGFTPLMHAVRLRTLDEIQALLALPGSDPLAQNGSGGTALMIAVQAGRADLLPVLLPLSDPHQKDTNGVWTALDYAALWDQQACLDQLLPLATGDELLAALELCIVNRRPYMAQVLAGHLPEEVLPAARTLAEDRAAPASFLQTALLQALLKREQALLAAHLQDAVHGTLGENGPPSALPSAPRPRL